MNLQENIRRILREELLNERLAEVDQDVDMIYDKFFKDDIEKLNKTSMISGDMFETKVGINPNAYNWVIRNDGDLELAISSLDNTFQRKNLPKEFGEAKIKGSIHHELAHWIDDTLHNKHIKKRIDKQTKLKTKDLGGIPVDMTNMEIQGQIHNIKQLYNKHKDEWDELTFFDMLNLSPSIGRVYNLLRVNQDNLRKWVRAIKTRMYREGLLGRKMY